MRSHMSCPVVVAVCCALVSVQTHADIFSVDNELGLGAGTVDTLQGLEFLDVTLTTNINIRDIEEMIGINGSMSSWRYASRAEVTTLVNNAGAEIPFEKGLYVAPSGPVEEIIDLVGTTRLVPDFGFGVAGVTGDSIPRRENYIFRMDVYGTTGFAEISNFSLFNFLESNERTGHWLVRSTTIPAPTSTALAWIGTLVLSRRRRG